MEICRGGHYSNVLIWPFLHLYVSLRRMWFTERKSLHVFPTDVVSKHYLLWEKPFVMGQLNVKAECFGMYQRVGKLCM